MRQLLARHDLPDGLIAVRIGRLWIGYGRTCRCAATTASETQGLDYSRPIDNGDPAAATPDGVELIPVNGRGQCRTAATVEKGH